MSRTLSEAASKAVLARYGVVFPPERLVATAAEAADAAAELGGPVVAKLCGDAIAHKTERGLVRLGLAGPDEVAAAAAELLAAAGPADGDVAVLVAPMLRSTRELIVGANRDPAFGPTVVLGVGGVLAEAVGDAVVRLAPLAPVDAEDMLDDLASQALLGPFRGEPPVDRAALVALLVAVSRAVVEEPGLLSADLNPVLVVDGAPVAVDALVELDAPAAAR